MDFDPAWLLLAIPLIFGLGWWSSRLDLRQARRDPRDAAQPYFKGLSYLLNEQQDKAIDAFIEAVQHDPETAELHFALGSLFRRRGETERAVRVHQHLLARGDLPVAERARAQYALAQDFFKAGLFDRAEAAYLALKGSSFEPEAELALLSLYERSRDWLHAATVATQLEARGQGCFAGQRAHYLCEQALQARAEQAQQQAQALLAQALDLAPEHPRALLLQAQWALAAADFEAALNALELLLRLAPAAFNLAAADYARAAQACGQVERARSTLQSRYALEPTLPLLLALGQLDPAGQTARLLEHLRHQPGSLNAARAWLLEAAAPLPSEVQTALERATKPLLRYRCAACGFEANHYFWQCPGCLSWDSFPPRPVEEL